MAGSEATGIGPGERPDAERILGRVAAWNVCVLGGAGLLGVAAAWAAGRPDVAWGIGLGAAVVAASTALSALVGGGRAGVLLGIGYVLKLFAILGVLALARELVAVHRGALLASAGVGVVASLAIDSIVVLGAAGPDFDALAGRADGPDPTGPGRGRPVDPEDPSA